MGSRVEELYYDYTYNLFLARTLIAHLPSLSDRQKVIRWIHKLSTSNNSIPEMRLRNDFLYYLVLNIQNGELRCPFTTQPPIGDLTSVAQLLPGGAEATSKQNGPVKSRERQASHDGGAFLVGRAVPHCGAFCYMAVCSKPDTDNLAARRSGTGQPGPASPPSPPGTPPSCVRDTPPILRKSPPPRRAGGTPPGPPPRAPPPAKRNPLPREQDACPCNPAPFTERSTAQSRKPTNTVHLFRRV